MGRKRTRPGRTATRRRARALTALSTARIESLFRRLAQHTALDGDEQAALAGILDEEVAFGANDVIVRRGDYPGAAFAVTRGWAARTMTLADGRRQIVNFMLPGDLFDLQVFAGEPADHTVRALTEVAIAPVDRDALMAVVNGASALSGALWWASVREEAVLREQVVRNGRRSAKERVAHILLELHHRLRAIGQAEDDAFDLPVGQAALADALGLSYVHVSRVLTWLEREGLIAREKGRVTLSDRAGLRDLCDFSSLYLLGEAASKRDAV